MSDDAKKMTVAELIMALEEMPPDAFIVDDDGMHVSLAVLEQDDDSAPYVKLTR